MRRLVPVPARIGSAALGGRLGNALGALLLATPPPFARESPFRRRLFCPRRVALHTPYTCPYGASASPGRLLPPCEDANMRKRASAVEPDTSGSPARRVRKREGWKMRKGRWGAGMGVSAMGGGRLRFPPRNEKTRPIGGYRAGGCTICGKPEGVTSTCGTDSREIGLGFSATWRLYHAHVRRACR